MLQVVFYEQEYSIQEVILHILSLGKDPPCRKAQPANIHFRDNEPGSETKRSHFYTPVVSTLRHKTDQYMGEKTNLRMLLVTRWNPMNMHV